MSDFTVQAILQSLNTVQQDGCKVKHKARVARRMPNDASIFLHPLNRGKRPSQRIIQITGVEQAAGLIREIQHLLIIAKL